MSEIAELKAAIDRLESRHAIADLVTAYAIACDEHDMPRLVDLFTVDGCFDSPSGAMVANGRDAIETMFIELFKVRGPAFHWTHDHSVSFDPHDPNRASGLVLSHAETCPSDVVSWAAMRYHDDYQRDDGVWRFRKRVISFLYYVPVTEYPTALKDRNRLSIKGQRLPADYPETLAPWLEFHRTHVAPGA
ncbi:MAG: nuclear transport factor 2 family protein [Gammaproteobacteria bacterium]